MPPRSSSGGGSRSRDCCSDGLTARMGLRRMLERSRAVSLAAFSGDDRAFLEAIKAAPDDIAVRLVYADWLEERGEQDKASFLRIEATIEKTKEVEEWRELCQI